MLNQILEQRRQALREFFRSAHIFNIGDFSVKPLSQVIENNETGEMISVSRIERNEAGQPTVVLSAGAFTIDPGSFEDFITSVSVIGTAGGFTTPSEDHIARQVYLEATDEIAEEDGSEILPRVSQAMDSVILLEAISKLSDAIGRQGAMMAEMRQEANEMFDEVASAFDEEPPTVFDDDPNFVEMTDNHSPEPIHLPSTKDRLAPWRIGELYDSQLKGAFTDEYLNRLVDYIESAEFQTVRNTVESLSTEASLEVYNGTEVYPILLWLWSNLACSYWYYTEQFTNAASRLSASESSDDSDDDSDDE